MSFEEGSWRRVGEVVFCEELFGAGATTTHVYSVVEILRSELVHVGENIYTAERLFLSFCCAVASSRRIYPAG